MSSFVIDFKSETFDRQRHIQVKPCSLTIQTDPNFFFVSFCLGFSAFYELIEWWVAELSGESAEAFLGTQGYVWDTQSDMFYAMIGAISALILLGKVHDKQLAKL